MRILREPQIYLLGKQATNDAEVDRFLNDHGVAWQTDTEVAGEHLVEFTIVDADAGLLLHELCKTPSGWKQRLYPAHTRGGPRICPRACGLEFSYHRGEPIIHP